MSLEVLKKAIGDIYDGVEAARQEFGRAVCERHGSAAWPYRWGTEKDEKARNPLALWPALLDAAKGDEEAALACLSSNAFKVGACRKLLGDAFDVHFETTTKGKLDEATGAKAAAFKLLKANQFNVRDTTSTGPTGPEKESLWRSQRLRRSRPRDVSPCSAPAGRARRTPP